MTSAIEHRGPDEAGHGIHPGVALGMRRLSIIDVAGSHQPVSTEDEQVTAVFNGEIFNFPELREELLGKGHKLATHGDSETIVHLYEEYGPDFVRRLRGMFAIALWDKPRRRLVLARDRMGVKPLYYASTPRRARLRLRGQGAARRRPGTRRSSTRSARSSSSPTASCPAPTRCSPACASSSRRR